MFKLTVFEDVQLRPGINVTEARDVTADVLPASPKTFGEVAQAVARFLASPRTQASAESEPLMRRLEQAVVAQGVKARLTQRTSARGTVFHQWDPLESTCRHASLSIL